jgi:hypothetical protein
MFEQKPHIVQKQKGKDGFFELYWSHLIQADKYTVGSKIPSVSGLFELYYQDEQKVMNLLTIGVCWRSGLRSQIRADIEPDLNKTEEVRKILENRPLFCRWTESDKPDDITDVAWFLNQMYFKEKCPVKDSGRFEKIFCNEFAPDQLHWV